MIARLQRGIVFGLFGTACAWLTAFWIMDHRFLAVLGTLAILFGYAGFLAIEEVLALALSDSGTPAPPLKEFLCAWWGEIWAFPLIFFWRQPFRSTAQADALPPTPNGLRGVLLVHGFVCNRAFWNPWMAKLRTVGISFVAINLEPPFSSISSHAATIDQAVARLTAATGVSPIIVGHSMGGLVARHWLAECAAPERVHRIITIGTPHAGTWLARFSRHIPGMEMAMKSAWLLRLGLKEDPPQFSRFTCFYSNADNVVFPASLATLPGADNRLVPATGHVQLAFHGLVYEELLRCLQPSRAC